MAAGKSFEISYGRRTGGLSAEQLHRMEENKRKAQEKLAGKRSGSSLHVISAGGTSSETFRPPAAKQPTLETENAIGNSHLTGCGTREVAKPHTSTIVLAPNPHPFHNSSKPSFRSTPSISSKHFASSSVKYNKAPSSSTLASLSQPRFSELQKVIKANFVLVSRTRFKVLVPFDQKLIEIFKHVPTKSYDAKTSTWNFGIEDYYTLVERLQRECKHVRLNLVPKPVISLFLSKLHPKKDGGGRKRGGSDGTDGGMDWKRVDPKLDSTLMQFQRDGVEYCVRHGGRVLIADDMGLGKTLQAIAVMCYYRSNWPLLVVCPSSVRFTWAEAFHRWVPSLSEDDVNVVLSAKNSATMGLVNIISYDLLVRMAKDVQEKRFMAIIADESHFLKNYKTARCKAVLPIVKAASCALLLSGTPALSRPIELFTQITALDKRFRVSLTEFGLRYCNGAKNHFGWDFSGASNMQELQMYMEDRIMIRRLKSDVLDQLPSKRRQMVLLDPSLTKGKSKEWKEMRQELDKAGKLKALDRKGALLPLYDKTGIMKIPAIRDYTLDLLEGGRKLIVFGHHRAVLDAICESLNNKKYEYVRIDGRTPSELRQSYCDRFQHDEQCLVAVLSITTANAGLTLTAASTVVFAELFWNPGILVQAEDRAYRIGQAASVNIHYLVARDTVDDFIWPLIQCKLDVLSRAGLAKEDFSKADSTVLKDMSQRRLLECFEELTNDLPSTSEDSLPVETAPTPAAQSTVNSDCAGSSKNFPADPDFREEKHLVFGKNDMVSGGSSIAKSSKTLKCSRDLSTGIAGPRKRTADSTIIRLNSQKRIKTHSDSSDTRAQRSSNASASHVVCCPTSHSASLTLADARISDACSEPPSSSTSSAGDVHEQQRGEPYKLQVANQGLIEGDFVDGDDIDDVSDWFANLDDQELMQLENFENGQDDW